MDDFSGPAILAFSRHVTILYCIGTVSISDSVVLMVGCLVNNELERFQKEAVEA
jgi:response regulator RpfG family c-di-GMP phosphodiesterase